MRIDPRTGAEATELDLKSFLSQAWGMNVGYTIAAYNDMAKIHNPRRDDILLIGIEALIRRGFADPRGPQRHSGARRST